jgi:hypothetical protein
MGYGSEVDSEMSYGSEDETESNDDSLCGSECTERKGKTIGIGEGRGSAM